MALHLGHRHPPGTWDEHENRRAFVLDLGRQLGFSEVEDWYRLTQKAFIDAGGYGLIQWFGGSVVEAVMEAFPDHDWKEWLFVRSPKGFWAQPANLQRWLTWFEEVEGLKGPEDWYRLGTEDFKKRRGGHSVLAAFGSVAAMAAFAHPEFDWHEWKFSKVGNTFWARRANRRRYVEWLGRELGFGSEEDFLRLTQEEVQRHYGGGLLARYGGSPSALLYDTVFAENVPRWVFHQVGAGYWDNREHRLEYLRWLGKELGFEKAEDWRRLSRRDLVRNHGGGLVQRYPRFGELLEDLFEDGVPAVPARL